MSLGDCSWAVTLEQNSQQVNLCSAFPLLHLYVETVFIQTSTSSFQVLLPGPTLQLILAASQGENNTILREKKKKKERVGKTKLWFKLARCVPMTSKPVRLLEAVNFSSSSLSGLLWDSILRSICLSRPLFSSFCLFRWEEGNCSPLLHTAHHHWDVFLLFQGQTL